MFKYNCIVSVYKKTEDDEQPLTKFTMQMENEIDVIKKVIEWFTDTYGWDDLEKITFTYDMVEENTEEFRGV